MRPQVPEDVTTADHAQLYDILVSQLHDFVVFLMDCDGQISSWNPGVARVLGYQQCDWIGQSVEIIFTKEDRAAGRLQEKLAAATEHGHTSEFRWHVRRDGSRLYTKETLVSLRDPHGTLLGFSKVMHDLTAHRVRESQLQDALAYAEGIVETLRQPLLVLDQTLRVRSASEAFYQHFQLTQPQVQEKLIYALIDGKWDVPQLHHLLEHSLQIETAVEGFELEYVSPQVGKKTLLLNARKLCNEGSPTGLTLLAFEDITARREAEGALAESEKQRRLIMDAAPALISYIGPDLRFRMVNKAYERWFGVSQDKLIGKPLGALFDHQLLQAIQPRLREVLAGNVISFERDYPALDGPRTLHVTYTPDFDGDGNVQGFMVLGNDISDRKTNEVALRESEERCRGLFERMGEGFFVGEMLYDQAGKAFDFRFIEVNPAFEVLTGVADAAGKTARQITPAIPDEVIESYQRVVSTGEPIQFELFMPTLRSSWYEMRARHTYASCFAVLFLNISERKHAEARLLESEQRQTALVTLGDRLRDLRDVPSLTATAMSIIGTTLKVARAGYGEVNSTQEFVTIGDAWTDGSTSTLAGTYRFSDFSESLAASLQRGQPFVINDVATHPMTAPESQRWEALSIKAVVNIPLFENSRLVALLFVQDSVPREWTDSDLSFIHKVADRTWVAAERARALQELQSSEEFTRSVLSSSPDCVKVLDLEGRLLSVNEGGCDQLEIEDMGACLYRFWSDFWGESKPLVEAALSGARKGHLHRFEGACPTFKGNPRWWEVVITPIRDASGQPVRILALSRDITERKRAEDERERLTEELQRSNSELSEFAHTVAHDLQSPLRGVTSFAQLLQKSAATRLSATDSEFLAHIVASAQRMAELIGALLRFAQVGQGEMTQHPVALDTTLRSSLESLQLQIEEKSATICSCDLPVVTGDPIQLIQLFQNLISNALKYSRPDVPPALTITSTQNRDQYRIAIQDNGEGIAPEYFKQIFEPLKRLHGVEVPGTGLGLAMCQRIVNRHGGRIWVESQPGIGSTFYFTLPGI